MSRTTLAPTVDRSTFYLVAEHEHSRLAQTLHEIDQIGGHKDSSETLSVISFPSDSGRFLVGLSTDHW